MEEMKAEQADQSEQFSLLLPSSRWLGTTSPTESSL